MSIRNLGDWSPLGEDDDPIYTDTEQIATSQKRYKFISDTIDEAVASLSKIVDTKADSYAGQWVEALKEDAQKLRDGLKKAGVRYHDVYTEIAIYQPELDVALTESAGALEDARDAQTAQTKADAMPDPVKGEDGTISSEEEAKGTSKETAKATADGDLSAAKTRLTNALAALDVAGKRLGDAVNCKKYEDGLTDSWNDKVVAFFGKMAYALGIITMILGVLAILIPGVNVILLAGVAAGALLLASNIVLYVNDKGSLADVILSAIGLGLAGLGAWASIFAKNAANAARNLGNLAGRQRPVTTNPPQLSWTPGGMELTDLGRPMVGTGIRTTPADFLVPPNPATAWTNMSDWFNNPVTNWLLTKGGVITPEMGFFASTWNQIKGAGTLWATLFKDPAKFFKDWGGVIGGLSGFRDLAAIMGAVGGKINPLWYVWGGINGIFGLGVGQIYTGGRTVGWIPPVNP